MKHLFLLTALLFSAGMNAQAPPWAWASSGGGAGNDIAYGVACDNAGNSYSVGSFNASATFGTQTITSIGGPEVFVTKYDPNGTCVWARQFGTNNTNDIYGDEGHGIGVDGAGNVYATGTFNGNATFGSYTLTSTHREIFVVKYDNNGNELWARQATGGPGNNYADGIAVDAAGNSYITGYMGGGTNTFGSFTITGAGAYAIKYDASGNVVWATKLGASGALDANAIAVGPNGEVYITGYLQGSENIGVQTYTSNGMRDMFLVKLSPGGNFTWLKQGAVTGNFTAYGYGVATDAQGNPFVTGSFEGTLSCASLSASTSFMFNQELFLVKYDSAGTPLWLQQSLVVSSTSALNSGTSVDVDANGNAFITGLISANTNLGTVSVSSSNGYVAVVVKYDPAGTPQWAAQSTGSSTHSHGIAMNVVGNIFISGFSKGPVTFGAYTPPFVGGEDMFIAKLNEGKTSGITEMNATGVSIYPNPFSTSFLVTLEQPVSPADHVVFQLFDVQGCEVRRMPLTGRQVLIAREGLAPGVYCWKISGENFSSSGKIVADQIEN